MMAALPGAHANARLRGVFHRLIHMVWHRLSPQLSTGCPQLSPESIGPVRGDRCILQREGANGDKSGGSMTCGRVRAYCKTAIEYCRFYQYHLPQSLVIRRARSAGDLPMIRATDRGQDGNR
jgi:hypothetical protein